MSVVTKVVSAKLRTAAGVADSAAGGRGHYARFAAEVGGIANVARAVDDGGFIGFGPTASLVGSGLSGANPAMLRSYWLRRVAPSDGRWVRKPIGVIIGGDREFCHRVRRRFWLPDSALFGHVQVRLREEPVEFLARWYEGSLRQLPPARWVPSPYFESAVRQQRPPVMVAVHHSDDAFDIMVLDSQRPARFGVPLHEDQYHRRFVDEEQLVGLLERDRKLQGALNANPGSDIWLYSCDAGAKAQAVADAFGRTTHAPAGYAMVHHSDGLVQAAKGGVAVPYTVDNRLLREMEHSLRDAPPEMQMVAREGGWNVTAVFMQPDPATGKFMNPVVTHHPR